ncbi:hypothetical protein [Caldisalinibacter kiritimatiensis]|uniref:Lipoprotein n=1 Tax=Caldisalinibacter kiritimatiensis TaxID=1304284 RepID=R1AUQ3_9FIRM|nr:hypothetical protein [Caldisalinibacter kiritimatiensis]EOD00883.1 hypothetical protein L21TH_1064 [Caldisalinibacter kiritimatiensis]
MKKHERITQKFLIIFFIIIVLTGCHQVVNEQKEVLNEFQKIIIFSKGKEIEILNETDLSNINIIISNMKSEKNNESGVNGIKGKIIFKNGSSNDFILQPDKLYIGDNLYQGKNECGQIKNIFAKYIYDKKYIISLLEKEENIKVIAKDIEIELILDDINKKKLIDTFTNANVKYNNDYPGIALVSQFPDYYIGLSGFNIHIINPNTLG